jgi:hypothetical protein
MLSSMTYAKMIGPHTGKAGDQTKKLIDAISSSVVSHFKMMAQFNVVIPLTSTGAGTGTILGVGGSIPGPVTGAAMTAVTGIAMGAQPPATGWFT